MHSPTSAEEEAMALVVADTSLDTLFPVDGARGGVRHVTPSACASLSIMLMLGDLLVGLRLFTLLLSNTIVELTTVAGGQWCGVSRERERELSGR